MRSTARSSTSRRPRRAAWQPALILISAGFDAHEDDPPAGCAVTTARFRAMAASDAAPGR